MRSHRLAPVSISCWLFLLGACDSKTRAGETRAAEPEAPRQEAKPKPTPAKGPIVVDGFATPEAVIHDPIADVYLVSNINGAPTAKDENGFISRVSPDGEVLEREWATGEGSQFSRLSAPKGLAIAGEHLVIADIDELRFFNRESGEAVMTLGGAAWTFLNGVSPNGDAGVLVTDTSYGEGGAVFRVGPLAKVTGKPISALTSFEPMPPGTEPPQIIVGQIETSASLGGANGVAVRGDQVLVAGFATGELYALDAVVHDDGLETATPKPITRPEGPAGQLDGLVVLDDGRLLVSSWTAKAVFAVSPTGEWTTVVSDVESPASIGYDAKRGRLLIPVFNQDRVIIHPL